MNLTVNGVAHRSLASPPLTPLLDVLREEFGIMSPKPGCRAGGCGACTVLVDGQPRKSCLVPLAAVSDAEVTTVEGLGTPQHLAPLQAAFLDGYASQCGYCTAGMLMAAQALLQRGDQPTDADIGEAISGHVCRCTGYVNIIGAIQDAARRLAGDASEQAS
jgi:aerobic carbon-monoxide dehydrogenase small subunit